MAVAVHPYHASQQQRRLLGCQVDRSRPHGQKGGASATTCPFSERQPGAPWILQVFWLFHANRERFEPLSRGRIPTGGGDDFARRYQLLQFRVDELCDRHLPRGGKAGQELSRLRLFYFVLPPFGRGANHPLLGYSSPVPRR